jgi:hypothetical protein
MSEKIEWERAVGSWIPSGDEDSLLWFRNILLLKSSVSSSWRRNNAWSSNSVCYLPPLAAFNPLAPPVQVITLSCHSDYHHDSFKNTLVITCEILWLVYHLKCTATLLIGLPVQFWTIMDCVSGANKCTTPNVELCITRRCCLKRVGYFCYHNSHFLL